MISDRHAYRTWHYVATIGFTAVCAWVVFGVGAAPLGLLAWAGEARP